MQKKKSLLPFLLIAALALFSLLPDQIVSSIYSVIARNLFAMDVWHKSDTQLVSNVGHLLGYAVLALVIGWFWSVRWWMVIILTMLVGAALEAAQLLVPTRQASFADLGFDAAGVGLALLVHSLWCWIRGISRGRRVD